MSSFSSDNNNNIEEELLLPNKNRYVILPTKRVDVFQLYEISIDCFWKTEVIDLSRDKSDWDDLSKNEQHFIKMVLAYLCSSDGIVCENLSLWFSNESQIPEIRAFSAYQNFMESIHSEMYSILIDTYIDDEEEKAKLFQGMTNYPFIQLKTQWVTKYINSYDMQSKLISISKFFLEDSDREHNSVNSASITEFPNISFVLVTKRKSPDTRLHTLWRGPM
jgi:ribonucleoside-diphosphate reductase beta chain